MAKLSYGFTLVEVLVSVAIIVILGAATIPLFAGLSDTQGLDRSVQKLVTDIKLTQGKAFAGAIYGGNKVMWGIQTCQSTNNHYYNLGYALDVDSNGVPDGSFALIRQDNLTSGFIFGGCTGTTEFYFTRISGNLVDSLGASFGSGSVEVIIQKDGDASITQSIYIQNGGKIKVD